MRALTSVTEDAKHRRSGTGSATAGAAVSIWDDDWRRLS